MPKYITCMFTLLSDVHKHTRKSNSDFFLPRVRLNVSKQFITFSGVHVGHCCQ